MIAHLKIQMFRSIVDAEMDLAPLTVLIGPNNAGKTNVLQAIRLLSEAVTRNLHGTGGKKPGTAAAQVECPRRAHHEGRTDAPIVIHAGTPVGWVHLQVPGGQDGALRACPLTWSQDADGDVPPPVGNWDFLARELKSSGIYCFELAQLRQPVPVDFAEKQGMRPDGYGLASFLFMLQQHRPDRWEALVEEFAGFVPEVRRVNFGHEGGQINLQFWEQGRATSTDIREASDGLVLLAGILAARYAVEGTAILLLEDPERGVHPRRLEDVTTSLASLAEPDEGSDGPRTQVILTSHSPYFLDRFKDRPGSVVVVERPSGQGTKCTGLAKKLEGLPAPRDASLGELWYSGVLGGVPAS